MILAASIKSAMVLSLACLIYAAGSLVAGEAYGLALLVFGLIVLVVLFLAS